MRLNPFTADSLAFRLVAGAALWSVALLGIGGYALSENFRDTAEAAFDARLGVLIESLVAASEPGLSLDCCKVQKKNTENAKSQTEFGAKHLRKPNPHQQRQHP